MTKKIEFKQPDPNSTPEPLELDESDVVWSDSISESSDTTHSLSPPASSSPHVLRRNLGLSAALSVDPPPSPHLRRKSTLNPTLSAASAARLIPPVPTYHAATGFSANAARSAPVDVPIWRRRVYDEDDGGGEEEVGEEMVPPHVMVARSQVAAFSVFEGVGRTLKGRDLRRVRNGVFQKTGFID